MTPQPNAPTYEMKPCPRCGQSDGCLYSNDGWFAVECDNCPCRTSNAHRSADEAIAAWNNRAPSEAETILALIREEAAKDNAPFGRADTLALNRIRSILEIKP